MTWNNILVDVTTLLSLKLLFKHIFKNTESKTMGMSPFYSHVSFLHPCLLSIAMAPTNNSNCDSYTFFFFVVCFTSLRPWGHYVWTSTSDSLVLHIALEPKESNLSHGVTVGTPLCYSGHPPVLQRASPCVTAGIPLCYSGHPPVLHRASPCVTVGITPKDEFWTKKISLRPMLPYVYRDHIKADTACLILSHRPSSF